jgi:hypothetical protein
MALPDRYEELLQSTLAFGSAGSFAEALDIISGALLRTINFDTVALFLSRGAPPAGMHGTACRGKLVNLRRSEKLLSRARSGCLHLNVTRRLEQPSHKLASAQCL